MLPSLLAHGGPIIWLLLIASGVGIVTFIERALYVHRAQINSIEFLNGVRNVLKRDNVVEALSICDATPGPVACAIAAKSCASCTDPDESSANPVVRHVITSE